MDSGRGKTTNLTFNTRLTNLYFVTRLTKGEGVVAAPINLILKSIDRYLFYPYMPKRVQSAKALRSYDVIKHGGTQTLQFFVKIGENSNIEISKFYPVYRRKMTIQTCF